MKRFVCFSLVLLMLISPLALPAMAAEETASVRVVLDKTDAVNVGETVKVSVVGENLKDNGAVLFALAYDPAYLSPVEDSFVENISGSASHSLVGMITDSESEEMAGKTAVKVAAYTTSGECFSGSGTVFEVSFEVLQKASAPGIPLELMVNLTNLYDNQEMVGNVQLYNAHVNAVEEGKTVTGLELKTPPTKTAYIQGQALDLTGGVMRVTYSDSSTEDLRLSLGSVTAYNPNQTGDQLAKVAYAGFEVSFAVSVEEKVFESISIYKKPSDTEYIVGEELSLVGGTLLKNYSNGTCEAVEMTDPAVSVSGFDSSTVGIKTITVTLDGKSTTFEVTVVSKKISKIEILSNPKTEYVVGQEFDCTGGKLLVTYADSTTEEVPMVAEMVQGFDSTVTGIRDVVIQYGNAKVALSVSVTALRVQSIVIETLPTKTKYIQGQSFNPAGGQLRVTYNNGTSGLIPLDHPDVTISHQLMENGVFTTSGRYNLNVIYKSKIAILSVDVAEKPSGTEQTIFDVKDPDNKAPFDVDATFNKGSATDKYKVNVSWVSEEFIYTEAGTEWDPGEHKWETLNEAGWTGTGVITVENHSSKEVTATFAYAPNGNDTVMEFKNGETLVDAGMTINPPEVTEEGLETTPPGKVTIAASIVSGSIAEDQTMIGTITVTIA